MGTGAMTTPRRDPILNREDLILALTQARITGETMLEKAPEYARGYSEGLKVAVELVRALDDMERAIVSREYEKR
jgi:hypothetical protein